MIDRSRIDLERFVRGAVSIRNDGGGRGFDQGIRAYDCPLCRDSKGRGWVHLGSWAVGCFNLGCPASPRLDGGAAELARRLLGLASRLEAWRDLERRFGGAATVAYAPAPTRGPDFCNFPREMRRFEVAGSPMQAVFEAFIDRQWGLRPEDAREWGLGWCLTGRYAWRVIIPVVMGGAPVGFQARTVATTLDKPPDDPVAELLGRAKYLTSSKVASTDRPAECGRPAASMLFNLDSLPREGEALLVEGAGDAMRWHRGERGRSPTAVAILGTALTPEKISLLVERGPERLVGALDEEPGTRGRALDHAESLRAWGFSVAAGRWIGGKDAGSGASLEVADETGGVGEAARSRLEGRQIR